MMFPALSVARSAELVALRIRLPQIFALRNWLVEEANRPFLNHSGVVVDCTATPKFVSVVVNAHGAPVPVPVPHAAPASANVLFAPHCTQLPLVPVPADPTSPLLST